MLPKTEQFDAFGLDSWIEWLDAIISGEPCFPPLPVGREELQHALIRLYRNLPERGGNGLGRAAMALFEGTESLPERAERFYYLLELLAFMRPWYAKQLLRRRLFEEALDTVTFGDQNIHYKLLEACGQYDVDEELADYICRSSQARNDFNYRLICARILAARSSHDAVWFVGERLIPQVEPGTRVQKLARHLKGIAARWGYRILCEWYIHEHPSHRLNWPAQTGLLESVLRERVVPWPSEVSEAPQEKDPFAILFSALVHIGAKEFRPSDLTAVADLGEMVPKQLLDEVLTLMRRTSKCHYLSGDEPLVQRLSPSPGKGVLFGNSGTHEELDPSLDKSKRKALAAAVGEG